MEKVSSKKDGKLKRYFLIEDTGFNDRKVLYYLRKGFAKDIIFYLMENESANVDTFLNGRKSKREKTKEVIGEMVSQGILYSQSNRGEIIVFLNDPDRIKEILKRFRESFLDSMSSNILSLLD